MANPEHLEILKQGVEAWNQWRQVNREVGLDLRGANLGGAFLSRVDLSHANLSRAFLRRTNFRCADLSRADLSGTDLRDAILGGASLCGANLGGAVLGGAYLISADLRRADLRGANFIGANLGGAYFNAASLRDADFTAATLTFTTFVDNDLSEVKGLKSVTHLSPSSIGIDTIYKSRGKIPEVFLRGCGLPEPFIVQIPALVAALEPIQFYSCFISYSSIDQDFAERLYADLQNKGVRCWFAPEDLKIGAEIRVGIDESIRLYDKLLLVLSEASVISQWVQQEVETALAKEREQNRTVLFPVRLDDAVMLINTGWPAYLKNTRNIGDFRNWKQHDSYQMAFDRLLRDLKAEEEKL